MSSHATPATAPVTPCTPDVLGYCLAVVVSIVVTWLALFVLTLSSGTHDDALGVLVYGWMPISVFAVPIAPVGVLLVHVACRRVRSQWVHVLAAGLAGVLTGFVVGGLFVDGDIAGSWFLALVLGIATAVGRAAVIPLVKARL